ncbi:MAG: cytochrome c oxidase assembly protein [Hyphomicrobiaceae bacterium]
MAGAAVLLSVAAAIGGLTWLVLTAPSAGRITEQMVHHIVIMNLAAPAIAWFVRDLGWFHVAPRQLALAGALQITVLWLVHLPGGLHAHHTTGQVHVVILILMALSAFWFWRTVFAIDGARRWQAIAALLITGKMFCLLGAIFTFAPRPLFAMANTPAALADQQLAGLVMLTACPLTYVGAAIALSVQWVGDLGLRGGVSSPLSAFEGEKAR